MRWTWVLAILGAFVAAAVVVLMMVLLQPNATDCGVDSAAYTDVKVDVLDLEPGCVRVEGVAHYAAMAKKRDDRMLIGGDYDYLFPLFAPGVSKEGVIQIMVHTPRAPDEFVSFENMTIEGRVRQVTPQLVPFKLETQLGERSNYYFSDSMVLLEPVRVFQEGQVVWTHPCVGKWTCL